METQQPDHRSPWHWRKNVLALFGMGYLDNLPGFLGADFHGGTRAAEALRGGKDRCWSATYVRGAHDLVRT